MRVAGFIPSYRCATQIRRVLQQLPLEVLDNTEVIFVVDNHSEDGTAEAAQEVIEQRGLQKQVLVLRQSKNRGLGGSFKSVYEQASRQGFSHLLMFHGDDQADWKDAQSMLEVMQRTPHLAALLGARFDHRSRLLNYPLRRRLANQALNLLLTLLWRRRICDIGSGLNIYTLAQIPNSEVQRLPDHIAFDLHLLFYLQSRQLAYGFYPIHWQTADQKSNVQEFRLGLRLLRDIFWYSLGGRSG